MAAEQTQQVKQTEWLEQWSLFEDRTEFLFDEWILPYKLEDFRGKDVLECGCGGGHHTQRIAKFARHVTAVDLNAVTLAEQRCLEVANVDFQDADIATMNLDRHYDVCICVGVVHHTDNPEKTVANLKRHLRPGGLLILWVYSSEGNALVRYLVEPLRRLCLARRGRGTLVGLARVLTALMYLPIYSIYLLPLRFLPYYAYFENFRRLSFQRNVLNVFDKLNAPQTDFISRQRAEAFVQDMAERRVSRYKNVSYRISGVKQ